MSEDVTCPFCGEDGFDLIGLKMHLLRGWCDKLSDVPLPALCEGGEDAE